MISVALGQDHRCASATSRSQRTIALGDAFSSLFAVEGRVRMNLDPAAWHMAGWLDGTSIRIDPYSARRRFCRIEQEVHVHSARGCGTNLFAVLDPMYMVRI